MSNTAGLSEFQVVLKDPNGVLLAFLDNYSSLSYSRVTSGVGALTIVLPDLADDASSIWHKLVIDGRIEVWKSVQGGPLKLDGETVYFIRRRKRTLDAQGRRTITVYAYDAVSLIARADVLYAAASAQAQKTDEADDMLKAIFTENVTTPTDARRAWASLISVQPNLTLGPSVVKGFSYRNALTVMQEICQASATAGTYLAFDIVCDGQSMEFRTFTGQRGIDRRQSSGNALIISPETGTLSEAEIDDDHTDEATYSYVGGVGTQADRAHNNATDTTRAGISPFGVIDTFYTSSDSDATALLNLAQSQLRAHRPVRLMSGSLIQTEGLRYGLHYGFGDYVPFEFAGETIDGRLDGVTTTVSNDMETINAVVRSEA